MKQKIKCFHKAVMRELKENRNTFLVYTGLRFLVFIVMIMQIFNKNYENVFLCILTLLLMIMPSVIQAAFKVEFPSLLEIIILFFIFAAEILGEISSFYVRVPHWDTMLHTVNEVLIQTQHLLSLIHRDGKVLEHLVSTLCKLLTLPIVINLGYELIKLCGRHDNALTRIIAAPGLWMQRITTNEPDDEMIEVGIAAVQAVLPEEEGADRW